MTSERRCGGCGAPISDPVGDELCPRCLAGLALGDGQQDTRRLHVREEQALGEQEAASDPIGQSGCWDGAGSGANLSDSRDILVEFDRELGSGLEGVMVDGYRVEHLLGSGGFAEVYRAREVNLDRTVALKFLRIDADDKASQLFDREARLLAQVSKHSGIVEIYSYGKFRQRPYFALEFMPKSLDDLLTDSPDGLPIAEAIRIIAQCAHALEFAHQRDILHRDIKPANILYDPESGDAKLADFGLAHLFRVANTSIIGPNAVVGSPPYMSPEQAKGDAMEPASDVYSLAATLYELCTGKRFVTGSSVAQILRTIRQDQRLPVRRRTKHIPRAVAKVIDKATAYRISNRYSDATAFAESLRAAVTLPTLRVKSLLARAAVAVLCVTALTVGILSYLPPTGSVASVFRDLAKESLFQEDDAEQQAALESGAVRPLQATPLDQIDGAAEYLEGVAMLSAGDYTSAETRFRESLSKSRAERDILTLGPVDYFPYRELGAALLAAGNRSEAAAMCIRSYNANPTDRALFLVKMARTAAEDSSGDGPSSEGSIKAEPLPFYAGNHGATNVNAVSIRGRLYDEDFIGDYYIDGLRFLPPSLAPTLALDWDMIVDSQKTRLELRAFDVAGHAKTFPVHVQVEPHTLDDRFRRERVAERGFIQRILRSYVQRATVDAQVLSTSRAELGDVSVEIRSPQDGDTVFRPDAYLEWQASTKTFPLKFVRVMVNGSETTMEPERARTLSLPEWVRLQEGENTIAVEASSKGDPLDQTELAQARVSVRHIALDEDRKIDEYLRSPESLASTMVLAFDGTHSKLDALSTRATFELSLLNAFGPRLNVRPWASIAGSLSARQAGAGLASQGSALEVARDLPIEQVVVGSIVDYREGTEIAAKVFDARLHTLITSASVFIESESGAAGIARDRLVERLEELASRIAMAFPRRIGLVGEANEETREFVISVDTMDGALLGQHLSVFRREDESFVEIARGRIINPTPKYSLCQTITVAEGYNTMPVPGDLFLLR